MAEIRWFGHGCFRIRAKEATIITDPVSRTTGYVLPKQTADIITISHGHEGHNNLAAIKPPFQVIDGPGEYEMHDVSVIGVRTFHDNAKGANFGHNTMYVIDVEGLRFAHLGDLGHDLTEEQAEALDGVDILFVPAGGGNVLSPDHAAEMAARIGPKAVIPMQYRTAKGDLSLAEVSTFCKQLGVDIPAAEPKLTVRAGDLGDALQLFLLEPESESGSR
ncbi:MAG TPA: MBL fold metallo-hydrolase [Thermomicrobiales bacterium]|nr:MBL fold metallo-hydrolase [Thermomicrobiales bacterium]